MNAVNKNPYLKPVARFSQFAANALQAAASKGGKVCHDRVSADATRKKGGRRFYAYA